MNDLPPMCRLALDPWKMFAGTLSGIFAVEAAIMLLLPVSLQLEFGTIGVAMLDSLLLTAILAPLLWWQVLRPLSELAEFRSRILDWAMTCEERKTRQLSRELHDGVGQLAASISIGLKTIEDGCNDPAVRRRAGELRSISRELHEAIRTMARGIRPAALDDLGLQAALESFLGELSDTHGVDIVRRLECLDGIRLPAPVETALFRVLQEGATNAVRHGRPTTVSVVGELADRSLRLSVHDDGTGFNPGESLQQRSDHRGPFGLLSMRERCRLLGGDLSVTSSAHKGTTVEIVIPLSPGQISHEEDSDRDRGRSPVVSVGAAGADQGAAGHGRRC